MCIYTYLRKVFETCVDIILELYNIKAYQSHEPARGNQVLVSKQW
jgi:hypothetical protein